jgi:hypothetical protein
LLNALRAGRWLREPSQHELPPLLGTYLELTVNVKDAKAIGLPISPSLALRADEVIE